MPQSLEERRPAFTPQLAMRVALLGGFAFFLFAIVFFRLWFLQVLTGESYVSQARENRVRKVRIEAPRGDIVDRNDRRLVTTRVAPVVQIVPDSLPESILRQADDFRKARAAAETVRLEAATRLEALDRDLGETGRATKAQRRERRRLVRGSQVAPPVSVPRPPPDAQPVQRLYVRLGRVIGMRPQAIHERVVQGIADTPYSNITIRTLTGDRAAFNYLLERKDRFRGVVVEKRYLREYPFKTLAAQLFGTVNEISPEQMKLKRYRDVAQGTRIGQTGLEARYDRRLRGRDGYTRIVVNSSGNRDSQARNTRVEPQQGERLQLTLDLGLQRAADDAMARAIGWAAANRARAGAYVAMDPFSGEILALGSYPSFDANVLARPISQRTYDLLTSEANGAPLLNRAIAAQYPTGSTFKPVTALAALESGLVRAGEIINDTGTYKLGTQTYQNARKAVFGPINLVDALKVSSDIFFYELGRRANRAPLIQEWARRLGMGRRTGIDLPGEFGGLIPDAAWRNAGHKKYLRCAKKAKVAVGSSAALYACGGVDRSWTAGDNVNLAVGQGDLQATPLQLATAYSTLVNDGTVVRPHLGRAIQDGNGRLVEELRVPRRGTVKFASEHRDTIMAGLRASAMEPRGTSSDIFSGYRWPVYGKTGTAERGSTEPDQSWYAVYVAHPRKPIVVVTTIERGGFGAETAAPAACLILNKWFSVNRQCLPGADQSR